MLHVSSLIIIYPSMEERKQEKQLPSNEIEFDVCELTRVCRDWRIPEWALGQALGTSGNIPKESQTCHHFLDVRLVMSGRSGFKTKLF